MLKLRGRTAIVAGAVALGLTVAGCASQSQMTQSPMNFGVGPGGILVQQPAAMPALNLESIEQMQPALPSFGTKSVERLERTSDSYRVNLDAAETATQAQGATAVKMGCGMDK